VFAGENKHITIHSWFRLAHFPLWTGFSVRQSRY